MADLVNLLPNESNEVFGELLWTEEKPVEGIEKKHVSDTNASIVIKKKNDNSTRAQYFVVISMRDILQE